MLRVISFLDIDRPATPCPRQAGMSPLRGITRLRTKPRLRAGTPACTKRFGEGRHFDVQVRACPCMDTIRRVTLRSSRLPEYLYGGQVSEGGLASAGFARRKRWRCHGFSRGAPPE